ncbi:MAG: maleylacetoacetate isomerase [Hyphomicrobiales bacterium]|nr:maleylacetoacetate isomerase [Hyphomicrobiales bacterium]
MRIARERDWTLKLYSRYRNSAGQRVRIVLNLKGVDYTYVPISEVGSDAYREINPQGLLPALETDGRVLTQSTALIAFIDESHPDPSLVPADPVLRAEARAFAHFIACEIHPINNHRVRDYLEAAHGWSTDQTLVWYRHWLKEGLSVLETMLQKREKKSPFCYGDEPSLADIYLVPQLYNARWYGLELGPYPLLTEVDAACRALPAFDAAMPEHQPDFPKDASQHGR